MGFFLGRADLERVFLVVTSEGKREVVSFSPANLFLTSFDFSFFVIFFT
jgi:hypothetical protein